VSSFSPFDATHFPFLVYYRNTSNEMLMIVSRSAFLNDPALYTTA